jgi:cellulose synthase/poly-beta-1,6-N-acetylglucosamine synthase-like glycosyltransferase
MTRALLPVSVVVPARDEGGTIDALIESLLAQSGAPTEIVVVDGGSRDDTVVRVRQWSERDSRIRLIRVGPAYPGEARNAGIAAAASYWVALTDAGIRVDREWLEELWRAREEAPDAAAVFGHYEPILTGWFTECCALAYVAPCVRVDGRWWRGGSFASAMLRRDLWERCGGFPPFRAAEDLILLEAIDRDGCPTVAAPGARVSWEIPRGPIGTLRRFACYSRHNLLAGRSHAWHRGVARIYACAAILAAGGALFTPAVWLLLPVLAGARALRAVALRRSGSGVAHPWRVDRLLGVAAVQLILDAATAWGTLNWLRHDRRWGRRRPASGGGQSALPKTARERAAPAVASPNGPGDGSTSSTSAAAGTAFEERPRAAGKLG